METRRVLKRGQIFLNRWAGWQTIFIYLRSDARNCHGIAITKCKSKYGVRLASYSKSDIQYDAEHFPCIGKMDITNMWINTALCHIITPDVLKEYDETGHRNTTNTVGE